VSTPRQQLAEQIKKDNPTWIVNAYPMTPKRVTPNKPVVSVFRTDVAIGGTVQILEHALTVHLYGAKVLDAAAEDEQDDLLDGIMLSLERFPGFKLGKASRATFNENTIAGWEITGTCQSANVYRAAVQNERSTP